jgi:hypothetical protein
LGENSAHDDVIAEKSAILRMMDVIPIKPERKIQLEEYAQRHGQDTAAALDTALAEYLDWERQDYREPVIAHRTRL